MLIFSKSHLGYPLNRMVIMVIMGVKVLVGIIKDCGGPIINLVREQSMIFPPFSMNTDMVNFGK